MKKSLMLLIAVLLVSTPAFAGLDMYEIHKGFKKADIYIKQGNPSAAASEYRAILEIKPNSFKANWELGKYHLGSSVSTSAKYFKNAILEKSSKRSQACNLFFTAGVDAFNKGNYNKAELYAKDISILGGSSSSLRGKYSSLAIISAKRSITAGNISSGKEMIDIARRNGYSRKQASTMVYAIGDATNPSQKMIDVYTYAYELNSAKNSKVGRRIAKYARSIEDPMKYSEKIHGMIDVAMAMTENGVELYVKTYTAGGHILKPNETSISAQWLRPGSETTYQFLAKKSTDSIELILANGRRINPRNESPKDLGYFKVNFINTQKIAFIIEDFNANSVFANRTR